VDGGGGEGRLAGGRGGGTTAAVPPRRAQPLTPWPTAVGSRGARSQRSGPLPPWVTVVRVATAVAHGGRRGARRLVDKSANFSNDCIILQND
jgi:hypothetical protein